MKKKDVMGGIEKFLKWDNSPAKFTNISARKPAALAVGVCQS